ncbi:MAG TPA: hypothetical protein PKV73_03895 [Agriterribacter sp.]|nr:hypothetical protein [Chitinophagaceae bacterium]HRP31001.1 hypothetical protein [Agriterribacter sp.]
MNNFAHVQRLNMGNMVLSFGMQGKEASVLASPEKELFTKFRGVAQITGLGIFLREGRIFHVA